MKFSDQLIVILNSLINKSETIPEWRFDKTPEMIEAKHARKGKKTMKNSSKKRSKENIERVDSKVKKMLKRQTVKVKNEYKPQDSKDYYHNLLKSINNRNYLLMNPQFEKVNPFRNSIKVGKGYYKNSKSVFSKKSKFKGIENKVIDLNVEPSRIVHGILHIESIDFSGKLREYRNSNFEDSDFQYLKDSENNFDSGTIISIWDVFENEAKINSVPWMPK